MTFDNVHVSGEKISNWIDTYSQLGDIKLILCKDNIMITRRSRKYVRVIKDENEKNEIICRLMDAEWKRETSSNIVMFSCSFIFYPLDTEHEIFTLLEIIKSNKKRKALRLINKKLEWNQFLIEKIKQIQTKTEGPLMLRKAVAYPRNERKKEEVRKVTKERRWKLRLIIDSQVGKTKGR